MTTDPNTLTLRQGKTWRVNFQILDGDSNPVSLAGYGARMVILDRRGGCPLLSVDDTLPGDDLDPGNTDVPVLVEPGGLIGQVHVRLGGDQTARLCRSRAADDASLYLKADATEIQPITAGPLTVIILGGDS